MKFRQLTQRSKNNKLIIKKLKIRIMNDHGRKKIYYANKQSNRWILIHVHVGMKLLKFIV